MITSLSASFLCWFSHDVVTMRNSSGIVDIQLKEMIKTVADCKEGPLYFFRET